MRGQGGFVRAGWDEINEIIAAANIHTAKEHGPDRIIGFSPIPAMSMVSYAAGSRYLSLMGGTCMSFYDWYCDLPASSPQTWGEQTDVPESADWYNSGFLILWGSNVPQTRSPDAHFYAEGRYKGIKSVVICPDYSEASKFSDLWLSVKQGTDSGLAMAFGHVILTEFHVKKQDPYFIEYGRKYTDFPLLVRLKRVGDRLVPERFVRTSDFADGLGEKNNPDWKTVAYDETTGQIVCPLGSIGFRWGEQGKWNLEERAGSGQDAKLRLSMAGTEDSIAGVAFPYFGGQATEYFTRTDHDDVLIRNVPVKKLMLADGETLVTTVYDLFLANYGVDRGFGGGNVATLVSMTTCPTPPPGQEKVTGVTQCKTCHSHVARQFADNAHPRHTASPW
jgi:nitrate reductase alpha subunit